jgi:hypothetical protein
MPDRSFFEYVDSLDDGALERRRPTGPSKSTRAQIDAAIARATRPPPITRGRSDKEALAAYHEQKRRLKAQWRGETTMTEARVHIGSDMAAFDAGKDDDLFVFSHPSLDTPVCVFAYTWFAARETAAVFFQCSTSQLLSHEQPVPLPAGRVFVRRDDAEGTVAYQATRDLTLEEARHGVSFERRWLRPADEVEPVDIETTIGAPTGVGSEP